MMKLSREKSIIMVGWKPPEGDWVKLNMNEAYFVRRTLGWGDIIRGMHDKCKGGFSKVIGKCCARRTKQALENL